MIFITGDTHGRIDVRKLNTKKFPEGRTLTKSDFVIVTGDFGFIWNGDREDMYWQKWFEQKPFTTLFVDGNHENFDLLNNYKIEMWNGGKVHKINDSIIHLMRGQVFDLQNRKFFTFGGAKSSDIESRKVGVSWWPAEEPSKEEYEEGLVNLEVNNWMVDYVVSHTCSERVIRTLDRLLCKETEIVDLHRYFNLIENRLRYEHWYFGHMHNNIEINKKQSLIYDKILKIVT